MSPRGDAMTAPRRWVLLHGFAGTPSFWDPLLAELPPELAARALAPALAGHGTPTRPAPPAVPGKGSFDAEVDRLAATLRAAGVSETSPAFLAGYSLGGRLALGLLVRHPELFAAAALVGAHPGLASAEERAARRAADERWAELLEADGLDAFLDAWQAQPIFATQSHGERAELRRLRRGLDPRALAGAMRALGLGSMPDRRPRLAAIETPVTLVAGERDAKFRVLGAEMAAKLPRAALRLVPGCGHNPLLEAPGALAALLAEAAAAATDSLPAARRA